MNSSIVYDINDDKIISLWFIIALILFSSLWIGRVFSRDKLGVVERSLRVFPGLVFLFVTYMVNAYAHDRYNRLVAILVDGGFKTVSGVVKNSNYPSLIGKRGSFTVNDVTFNYLEINALSGFSNKCSKRCILRDGMQVEVFYVEGSIIRLAVKNKK